MNVEWKTLRVVLTLCMSFPVHSGWHGLEIVGENTRVTHNEISCTGNIGLLVRANRCKIEWLKISLASFEGLQIVGSYNYVAWVLVLTLVVVGSPGISIVGDYNQLVWAEVQCT